ncbi:hypothetical protein Enr13x_76720 [Stieleria neptunia]|uniref:Uncharacterized protein n=1 Tax=Stieleria neptunia TaxID=2527979 RepID=A0A518I3T5_9BACT|nr:hypothetical protein [Stieleria neptunia]QDV47760.1 hypothetical protein Enr13x_76720 [Stieleria neptunia]
MSQPTEQQSVEVAQQPSEQPAKQPAKQPSEQPCEQPADSMDGITKTVDGTLDAQSANAKGLIANLGPPPGIHYGYGP